MMLFNPFRKLNKKIQAVEREPERKRIPLTHIFGYPYLPMTLVASEPHAWEQADWRSNMISEFLAAFIGNPDSISPDIAYIALNSVKEFLNEIEESPAYLLGGYKISEFAFPQVSGSTVKRLFYVEGSSYYGTDLNNFQLCLGEVATSNQDISIMDAWIANGGKVYAMLLGAFQTNNALRVILKKVPEILEEVRGNRVSKHLRLVADINDNTKSLAHILADHINHPPLRIISS